MRSESLMIVREMASIPDRPSNVSVVEACTLLNVIDSASRAQLAQVSFMAYAERSEMIVSTGSPSEFVAIVGAGFIKMTKSAANGQEMAMELLGPGQCLGLLAAIEGRPYPLSAVAVTNCWYLKVPTREILSLYRDSGALKDAVIRNIGPRLRKAHDMMMRLSSVKVEERIAAILFILSDSYGITTSEGIEIGVPLTRQDIAEMAGTTVETTIRVLSRWQKEGVVSTDRQRIKILKEATLLDSMNP